MTEKNLVKGEIEGWGAEPNVFKGARGSLGLKIEGEWHNLIDKLSELERLQNLHPKGTYVQFEEEENKRGYLDIVPGTLKAIEKSVAYEKPKTKGNDYGKDIDFSVCFKRSCDLHKALLNNFLTESDPPFIKAKAMAQEILDFTKQLYLDFQKAKNDLQKEGKW